MSSTDNFTTERVDHPPRVRKAIDELMYEKDATDNRTTLLPCPFCGGEAELVEGEYGMYLTGYAIYCKGTCGAKLGVTGRLCEAYEWTPYFDTEAEAIAAWNTRAERTCKSTTDDSAWCFVCSECGKSFPRNKLYLAHNHGEINYCPNCGARVERGDA